MFVILSFDRTASDDLLCSYNVSKMLVAAKAVGTFFFSVFALDFRVGRRLTVSFRWFKLSSHPLPDH